MRSLTVLGPIQTFGPLFKLVPAEVRVAHQYGLDPSEGSAKDRLSIFAVLHWKNGFRTFLKISEFQTLKSFLFENAVRVRWLDMFIRLHNQHIIHPQREPRLRKPSSDLNYSILLYNNYLFFIFSGPEKGRFNGLVLLGLSGSRLSILFFGRVSLSLK